MSDKIPALLMQEPHVTFAMAPWCSRCRASIRLPASISTTSSGSTVGLLLQGGPLVNDDDRLWMSIMQAETSARWRRRQSGESRLEGGGDLRVGEAGAPLREAARAAGADRESWSFEPDLYQGRYPSKAQAGWMRFA